LRGKVPGRLFGNILGITGLVLLGAARAAGADAATDAAAPATAPALESITVTGSYLRRTDTEIPSPVTSISAEEISKSGMKTIADVIRSVSADNSGTLTQSFSGAMAGGASGVSLRGLSVDATLVLLDGHRMAPYPLSDDGQRPFVDISSLPLGIVERVEILRDGASAIYGSDAIAGVVNIILKKQFVGLDVAASAGTSYKLDGGSERASITYGFGDLATDTRNVYLNLEVRHQDAIAQEARGSYLKALDLSPWNGPDLRGGLTSLGLPLNGTTYSVPGQVLPLSAALNGTNEAPFLLPGCASQNLVSSAVSNAPTPVTTRSGSTAYGCAWDTNLYKKIQPKTDGLNLSAHWTQNLGSGWQSQASINYFHSESEQYRQSDGYNVGTNLVPFAWAGSKSGTVNQFDPTTTGVLLPANHPDNPFNPANLTSAASLAAQAYYGSYFSQYIGQPALFFGALTDIGPQHSIYKTDVYRLVEDVNGTLGSWDVSASVGYITDLTHVTYENFLKPSAFYAALANGSYRVGQNAYLNSPALYAAIAPTTRDTATTGLGYISANAERTLLPLPGGNLSIATGVEARHLANDNPGQPGAAQGDVQMDGSFFAHGSQSVFAGFAELSAPVLRSLELEAAARADHYQGIGYAVTPKVGFKFKPVQELAFRGTYARGFRAPGIAESGNSGSASSVTSYPQDPLRCQLGNPAYPNTLQDCALNGSSMAVLARGNPNLQPEKSHSITLGFILEPVQQLSVTADYFRIRRDNEIAPAPYTAANAVRSPASPGSSFPGPIIEYLTPFVNSSYSLTSGIDAQATLKFDLHAYGRITAKLDVTHLLESQQTFSDPVNGDYTYHYAGTVGPTSLSGAVGTPATRGSFTVDWTRGPMALGVTYYYRSPMKGFDESGSNTCIQLLDPGNCYVASFGYATVYGQYQFNDHLELTGTITNVTNRLPPLDTATYGGQNYDPSLDQAGAIGRYLEVGFRYHL
jgi:iron complex outermembrane receptor protein